MWELSEFQDAFRAEVGDDLMELVRPSDVARWVNEGQAKLRFYRQQATDVTWADAAETLTVPADFHRVEKLVADEGYCVPRYHEWGGVRFDDPVNVTAGSGKLWYWANWPVITGSQASLLPEIGDQACLSYALYRLFKRLASSRADFRLYASLRQANGVTIDDLDALSERHLGDFEESRDVLVDEEVLKPEFYFGG